MLARLLPVVLLLAGLAAGAGAGLVLRPAPPAESSAAAEGDAARPAETPATAAAEAEGQAAPGDEDADAAYDYVKLNNQFVVPVVEEGRVAALVILSLSLEVTAGQSEAVYQIEPKLRDSFLQVMFDHANAGGFKGTFTDGSNMVLLRQALREVAQRVMGEDVSDVLIVDIVRQDS
jgi:polyisoprenoid-binding protein YceI